MWRVSTLWRGDLSPMGCEAAPNHTTGFFSRTQLAECATASPPDGDKSPVHRALVTCRSRPALPAVPCATRRAFPCAC
ncbi:hypothetical protein DMX04_24410 [Pseudomonas koreensis]|nr:hypothetical protein DMX04_24410 [Pseudomonas koreensis]